MQNPSKLSKSNNQGMMFTIIFRVRGGIQGIAVTVLRGLQNNSYDTVAVKVSLLFKQQYSCRKQ